MTPRRPPFLPMPYPRRPALPVPATDRVTSLTLSGDIGQVGGLPLGVPGVVQRRVVIDREPETHRQYGDTRVE